MTAPPWEGIKLAAWNERDPRKTVFDVGPARIGRTFTLLTSLEGDGDRPLVAAAARSLREAGAGILHWAGTGTRSFAELRELAAQAGLSALVEVTDTKEVALAAAAADVLMVGAANMQNFSLLKELGRSAGKPVLLVRGWHATLKEWLNSAEYVLFEGNPRVILCEAGIRSFEGGSRVILDLSVVPAVKGISHLPIIVNVSRAGGPMEIEKMGLAAVAVGADGLMVEVALPARAPASPGSIKGLSLAEFSGLAPKFAAMSRLVEGIGVDHA